MDAFTRRVVSGRALQFSARLAFVALCLGGLARPAAAQYYWATTGTGLWTNTANWSLNATSGGTPGTVPPSSRTSNTVYFNQSSVNGDSTVELSGTWAALGFVFNNTGSTLVRASASGTQSLTSGNGGLTVNLGAGPVTFGDATNAVPVIVEPNSANSSITNHSGSLLRFSSGINHNAYNLTFTGSGAGGVQVDGNFASGSPVIKSGSGALVFTGSMRLTNSATISSGTMAIAGAGTMGTDTWNNAPLFGNWYLGTLENNGAFVYSSSARSAIAANVTGTGAVAMTGSGMLSLMGTGNSWTGPLTISSGTVAYETQSAAYPGIVSSRSIRNDSVLIINTCDGSGSQPAYGGSISGTGRMIVTGPLSNGSQWPRFTLFGTNSFSGPLAIQSGTVALSFSGSTSPAADVLSPAVNVAFGSNFGAAVPNLSYINTAMRITPRVSTALTVTGSAGVVNSQSLAGLTINDGIALVGVTAPAGGSMTLSAGGLQRSAGSRGIVSFTGTAAGTTAILTTATNDASGIIGPWVVFNTGATQHWATAASGTVQAYADYAVDTWASGSNTNVTAAATVPAGAVTNSLRFNANQTVTLAGPATVSSGGILFASAGTLTGGVLRGPLAGGLQITTNAAGTIESAIADNGGPTGLTYLPLAGSLTLRGNNTYTGASYIAGSVTLDAFESGTSGPLGVGGQIQLPTNGAGPVSSVGGASLVYTPLTSADYSTRFSTTAAQTLGVNIPGAQRVTWAGSIQGGANVLTTSGNGVLVLSGSNDVSGGISMGGPVVLGSADALGSTGAVNPGSGNLRYTAASAGLDLGARISLAWGVATFGVDTNGQNVTWATRAAASGNSSSFLKKGFGQLTLTGSLNTNNVIVAGGTFALDASVVSTGTIWRENGNNVPNSIRGVGVGTFRYSGAAGLARTLTVASADLQQGLLTLAVDNAVTGTSMIAFTTSISRSTYLGTIDFRAVNGTLGSTSVIRTAAGQALSNGILGPWASVNGTDWATHTSGTILPYAAYTPAASGTLADDATTNVRIDSTGGTFSLAAATTTVNTLLQSATTAATVSLPTQTFRTGGVMIGRGSAGLTIGDTVGSGTLQSATANGELVLSNFGSGTMVVNSPITTNGTTSRLTISGDGRVVLTGSNTYVGPVAVQGGTLVIGELTTIVPEPKFESTSSPLAVAGWSVPLPTVSPIVRPAAPRPII
ncbi:MAG: beta strand repeat-containing protein, partial [Planctomycetia bacterium]